jgi:hypothetical protein
MPHDPHGFIQLRGIACLDADASFPPARVFQKALFEAAI